MDRFSVRLSLGFVGADDEISILDDYDRGDGSPPVDALAPCITFEQLLQLRASVRAVHVSDEIKRFIVDVVAATRSMPAVIHGASPRASLALMQVSQALALFKGEDFVTADTVGSLCTEVIAHRLVLDPQAIHTGTHSASVVAEAIETVGIPH